MLFFILSRQLASYLLEVIYPFSGLDPTPRVFFKRMKKSSQRRSDESPGKRASHSNEGSKGRWEFTSSGSLISLGATEAVRRAAYRTATGELRFLPL
jgi:hypothetical protein